MNFRILPSIWLLVAMVPIGLAACGDDEAPAVPSASSLRSNVETRTPTPTPTRRATPSPTLALITPAIETPTPAPATPASGPGLSPAVLVGAGDIASCTSNGDEAVASLLDTIDGIVFTAGDNVYPDGTTGEFAACYEPSWGRHRARTRPAPGNHDYHATGALPYFEYFGDSAGAPGQGYYSYEAGAWHVISLNSNCGPIGGCGTGSPQMNWLLDDLAAHPSLCTVAYWHAPVLTIGPHANDEAGMLATWQTLYDHGVDIVVNGHEHNYQRYTELDRDAAGADPGRGIRMFVVGTGGSNLTNADTERANGNPNLEVWADAPGDGDGHDVSFGVLKLTLSSSSYEWEFVPVAGETFTDSGFGQCH